MNQQEKYVLQLQKKPRQRKKDKVFVVEGIKMFIELPQERIKKIFVSESFLKEAKNRSLLQGRSYETVKDGVFQDLSDTKTPQGILAIVQQYEYRLSELWKPQNPLVLILDTIQDPGNLGTIVRAGEAAGVSGILLNQESADIYNPKVIRSTMGALYRIPFYCAEDFLGDIQTLKQQGIRLYAAHLKGKDSYETMNYCHPSAFMIGNESKGLREEVAAMADQYIRIPMCGKVESLNAAIAASVLLFEAARQRRSK